MNSVGRTPRSGCTPQVHQRVLASWPMQYVACLARGVRPYRGVRPSPPTCLGILAHAICGPLGMRAYAAIGAYAPGHQPCLGALARALAKAAPQCSWELHNRSWELYRSWELLCRSWELVRRSWELTSRSWERDSSQELVQYSPERHSSSQEHCILQVTLWYWDHKATQGARRG